MDIGRLASVALGAALLWAGGAKLADPRWPAAAAAFGVARGIARAVGPVELALGAALVVGLAAPGVALAAAALLVAYTALLVRELRADGEAPPCACFGGWRARPISWRSVARNAGLLTLAALAIAK